MNKGPRDLPTSLSTCLPTSRGSREEKSRGGGRAKPSRALLPAVGPEGSEHVSPDLWPLLVDIAELRPDPRNARRHTSRNVEVIGRSLARFGQQKPIVIDADGVVVAGNGTMQAARALGWSRIAAVRSELSGPERVAFALADNRSAELAQWDDVDLAFLLGDLSREDQLVAGFNDADIARLMKDAAAERPAAAEPREPRVKPLKLDAEQRRVVEEVAAAVRDQHGRPDMPEAQAVVVALLEWISSGR